MKGEKSMHRSFGVSIIKDLDDMAEFIKEIATRSPGPFIPEPGLHELNIDKISNGFVLPIPNGFLVNKGGEFIGVGPLPSVFEVLAAIDEKVTVTRKPSVSIPSRLDWIRYHAALWEWYDRKPLGGTISQLNDWLDDLPINPLHH